MHGTSPLLIGVVEFCQESDCKFSVALAYCIKTVNLQKERLFKETKLCTSA